MLKLFPGIIFLLLIAAGTVSAQTDTLKKDSVKIDTNLLNRFHIDPGRNSLPVIYRPVQIKEEHIPVAMLDYKVSYWHKSVVFGLNFTQSAFSNNYSAGGVNAVALGTNLDFKAEYNKTPFDYTTEVSLLYGISKNKGQGARKTNDRIFYDNKVATQLSKHWFLFGSLSFESQFTKGFNYTAADGTVANPPLEISNFLSPGYLTESFGFEYKPAKYFDLRLGLATDRQTFVIDTTIYHNLPANYGVPIRHTTYNQLATQIIAAFDKDIAKNMHLNVRYALFIPYVQPLAYTTHRVDAVLTAKVNRLVAVTVNGTLLYDKNTSIKLQGTESLALGIVYKFP